jgi:hypothetical protein
VLIESDQPLVITARTYTESREGSFGSFLPGVAATQGLEYGGLGVISQLSGNRDFRTNVGLVNLVDKNCSVRVRVYGINGSALGSAKTVTINSNSYKQINDVFKATGAGTRNDAYVTVEVTTPSCTVWGYGAVIDGTTNAPGTDDATSIPMTIVR